MIDEIYEEIRKRNITRLCHFVHTNVLLHILNNNEGVKAVDFINQDVLIQNDKLRLDGKTEYINCSVQYPNWWYLRRVKDNNPIFSDWAILFIDPIVATIETTQFCKVNAATRYGAYIYKGVEAFREMFSANVGRQNRTIDMLQNAPTDDQAEVLVYESIPVSMIKGIVFENEKIARQKIVEWKVMGFPKIDVFISPELFDVSTSGKIRSGVEPVVRPYREEKMSCSKKEKYTGALIGAAIGDALGWPNEQNSKNIRKNRNSIRTYVEWNRRAGGKYWPHEEKICAGEYSDDTQLIIATARSLLRGRQWSNFFAKQNYQRG